MKRDLFLRHLAGLFERPTGTLAGGETLESLEWDSIRAIEFISLVDEHFGKEVSLDALSECVCLNDLVALVGDRLEV